MYHNRRHGRRRSPSVVEDDEEDGYAESQVSARSSIVSAPPKPRRETRQDVQEKRGLLFKLHTMRDEGKVTLSDDFTMASPIDEVRDEYARLSQHLARRSKLDLQRNFVLYIVSALELGNNSLPYSPLHLDGWSDTFGAEVYEDKKYDSILEELQDKYSFGAGSSPELRFLMLIGGSALVHHNALKSNMQNYDGGGGGIGAPSSGGGTSRRGRGGGGGGGGALMNLLSGVMGGSGGILGKIPSMLGFGSSGDASGPTDSRGGGGGGGGSRRVVSEDPEDDQRYGTDYDDDDAVGCPAAGQSRAMPRPMTYGGPAAAPAAAPFAASGTPTTPPAQMPRKMKGPDVSDVIRLVKDEAFNGRSKDTTVDLMS